jgi:hypothetical protein
LICTAMDARNIALVQDLLQAKMIVAVLRMAATFPIYRRLLVDAADLVNRDGFMVTGEDVRVACENYGSVVGMRVDLCKAFVEAPTLPPLPEPEKKERVN